ncbi:ubiquitin carboxyl-terminal hydrolase 8-like [Mercenaria mercenaria]|uniref:ubiquitin carboxyl-terminal hydrolase 8-like n=1 Tax=Mercenaria mercenaria TaxID=6596 RepID=UPI00234F5160|nr:ubiquitin carboxyl-terminal hydrolase 8-like [Mercenaria mercenaria]XP_053387108.1 ubiquitin carboxyl-terminal hydrolase 8-like [Mercenaria mercenaria]XP_053387109.1 ubiquitin carboxyl-terminal hydrolase 8-like [Mercenaria mercenaria]
MPGSTKKDLYIAKSIGQLNEMAELPAKFKTTHAKLLVKTADKMLKEAQHSEMIEDEERAYVLFMKYFNVVTFLKKTADYKKQKAYYDDLLGTKNLLTSIDKAEVLSGSLKERYDQLEAEHVASKLSSLDTVEKKVEDKVEVDAKHSDKQPQIKTDDKEPKPEEPVKKTSPGVISCSTLFDLFEDRDAQVIIMDVRPMEEFQETRINHKNIINVPAEAIKPGTTVTYIEKALPMDSLSLWKQRGNIDHIILLDWNSSIDKVKIGTSLQTLKDALYKYDSTVIIKSEPLILDGGYEQWMLQYPTKCVNPVFDKLKKPVVSSTQDSLMDFDYPDFDETFMEPKPAKTSSIESSNSSSSLSSASSVMNGDISGNLPRIDRSTKPKIDRSTKSNVTTTQVNANKSFSSSLYPDVRAVSKPGNSLYSETNEAGSKSIDSSFRNTDSRAESVTAGGSRATSQDIKNSSTLAAQSTEISDELKALEQQKKQKMEEIRKLQENYEKIEAESRARMEQMASEEKKLSDLEELKRKQQTDVADLMRMKKNLHSNMAEEKQHVQQQQQQKEQEESNRREELEQLTRAEEEKRRRQEEVNRLRMDRKKKEEDRLQNERKMREEKELQDARERARQEEEQRKKDVTAAEERARQVKAEEDRKAAEKSQIEERLQMERELAAKMEKERLAALEEKRKQQAELDRLEAERREKLRLEKERAEKERLDREKRERDEEDRKRAEEAKRVADEKLRLMNEAKSKAKLIPSPNLQKGWEKQLDPSTNRYFYINHHDGTTQWEPPNLPGEGKGGTYVTRLKDEPSTLKSGLKRSNSSPNIAKMMEDESKLPQRKAPPSVDRGNKPVKRQMPVALPAKRRDLNPVYGNVGCALTGLRNLGNTCYMNSTIQCLNNTSPLVTYLLTDLYLYDINRGEKAGNLWEVTDDFAYLVKSLWSGQYRFITPRDFKSVVGRQQPMFAGYEQQDSQEFLTFLLDSLHEGLNKVKTRPKIAEQDNDKLPDHIGAELAWKNHKLHNESIIVELFQGQLKSTIMCLTCRKRSVTFQAFMFLSLPIPSSNRCTLQDCLRQFAAEEKMTGSSRWKCPQCKCYRDSVKNIVIWKLPHILLIALNRFVYEGQWRTKINAHVDFPVRGLDMTTFVKGPQPKPYKLYAVSNHFGTLDGGHYTACCRNPNTQKWYKFDDHEVYDTSESSVKTSAAYVLYYTSIDLLPPDFKPSFT